MILLVSGEQNYPAQAQDDKYSGFDTQIEAGVNKPELHPHKAYLGLHFIFYFIIGIYLRVCYQMAISSYDL